MSKNGADYCSATRAVGPFETPYCKAAWSEPADAPGGDGEGKHNLTDTPWQGRETYDGETFRGIVAPEAVFTEVEFLDCRFEACRLAGARFERCSFSECLFERCDLSVVRVRNCRFADVTFTDCKMIGIDWTKVREVAPHLALDVRLTRCTISLCSFYGLDIPKIEIVECIAHESDFGEADLHGATMRGTDFQDATFLHTDLAAADFRAARNYAIDLRHNTLTGARFSLPEAVSLLRGIDIVVD